MTCERVREGLKELIPELIEGSDDHFDSGRFLRYMEKECPSNPDPESHTATLMLTNKRLDLTLEREPIKFAVINTRALLKRHGRVLD